MDLLNRILEKFDPRWEIGRTFNVIDRGGRIHIVITKGWHRSKEFTFREFTFQDDNSVDVVVDHVIGVTPRRVTEAIFQVLLMNAIDNYNELHREILNDNTEDCGTNYFEEPVDERRVRPPSATVSKE